jgi:hypothetical protein
LASASRTSSRQPRIQSTGVLGSVVTGWPALGLLSPPRAAAATELAGGRRPGGATWRTRGRPGRAGRRAINRPIVRWLRTPGWTITPWSTSAAARRSHGSSLEPGRTSRRFDALSGQSTRNDRRAAGPGRLLPVHRPPTRPAQRAALDRN